VRVHIICRNTHKDRILPRLANALASSARWTLGNAPDERADVNYFFPYLEWHDRGRSFKATPTAAWFTHRDTYQDNGKVAMWDECAAGVDLRLTTARHNVDPLSQYGMTRMVTPPLDTDKFKPVARRAGKKERPVVGVSGYVCPGGRKGEAMIARLVAERPDLEMVATGQGWPVTGCKEWEWEDLHKFYHQLDVYLCSSLLEGVGYPPLEALASGVPVVIPAGTGLFDDLPDMPGIERFPIGDYEKMLAAIDTVLSRTYQPASLRAAVEPYTLETWRTDHERAFEDLLCPPREIETTTPLRDGNHGIYCVAFGKPSRGMAEKLITSVKANMPAVPVCLVSTEPLGAGEDVFVEQEDRDIGGRIAKIKMCSLAPEAWEYVLYLDADTEIVADVSVMFQFLADGWELVICKNPDKYHVLGMMARPDNKEETTATFKALGGRDLLQLNGGVMAFRRNERVCRFFDLWYEEWDRWGARDQAALHRALWRQPLAVYVLGNEWNTITRYDKPDISAGILHHPTTARRWTGRIDGRLDSQEAWAKVRA